MRTVLTLTAALAVGLLAPSPGTAATFKVNCATKNLQNRINAVPAGSVLLVKGTCGPVSIDKNITLDGNPTATISGGGANRPVTISGSPTVKLVDLRITGGKISAQLANGGGIYHPGGLLVLRRTVLTGNVAESIGPIGPLAQGGGIYSTGGTIQLFNSSVRNNTARAIGGGGSSAYGGGIIHTGAGALLIDHSSVTGNRARSETASATTHANGGGIYDSGGKVTIRSSKVNGNVATATGTGAATGATARGGALVDSSASPLSITGSSVSGNSALSVLLGGVGVAQGGGLDVANAKVTIKGTVLDDNAARATSSASATMWALGAAVSLQSPVASSIQGSKVTKSRGVVTTGGTATASGAGFYVVGRPLVVSRSLVASNFADATGGSGPATAEGGGLSLKSGANIQLVGSTVRANRADSGGGLSTSTGGGIASASSILRVRSSTLNANVAATSGQALGGGIHLTSGGPHTVENSTLSGNRANGTTARGGAIDVDTTLAVTSATIARNSAKLGGGIYVEGGTTTLRATLLGLNTATMSGANCSQSVASAGRNLVASTLGCTFAATGTDKTGLAPKIGLLGAHGGATQTIPLLKGSPALNAIPKAQCPFARDQRGVKRPQGSRCDIGAYERKP